jgi:mono/diheme cytochrome c family protein
MRAPKVASSPSSSSATDARAKKSNGGAGQRSPRRCSSARLVLLCAAALLIVLGVGSSRGRAADVANPFEGRADLADEGRGLFNQYCAHCHGTNAFQGERPRDLRRLRIRYGPRAPQAFDDAVSKGRLDKGMPVWKSVLGEDQLWRIFTFLETVQTPP